MALRWLLHNREMVSEKVRLKDEWQQETGHGILDKGIIISFGFVMLLGKMVRVGGKT